MTQIYNPCSIKGCPRFVRARGWCVTHLALWYKWGNPLGRLKECPHCGCVFTVNGTRKWCTDCLKTPGGRGGYLLKTYDLTESEFDAMYFDQDGQCAIESCVKEATDIDHCHATGKVRSLLCRGCNVQLGHLEMDSWYGAAIKYLDEWRG